MKPTSENCSEVGLPEDRKTRKPLMEKKRRARINDSLETLKKIILEHDRENADRRSAKLEKADILELAVNFLTRTVEDRRQRQHSVPVVPIQPYGGIWRRPIPNITPLYCNPSAYRQWNPPLYTQNQRYGSNTTNLSINLEANCLHLSCSSEEDSHSSISPSESTKEDNDSAQSPSMSPEIDVVKEENVTKVWRPYL